MFRSIRVPYANEALVVLHDRANPEAEIGFSSHVNLESSAGFRVTLLARLA